MADVIWADVVAVDPGVATLDSWAQRLYLAEANALNPNAFDGVDGPRFKLARVFLAAHRGRRGIDVAATGAAGPVTSESLGGMAVSYATPATSGSGLDDFGLTAWGQQYQALCRTSPRARLGAR